jgi:thiol:disulfide interchange protein
MVGNRESGKDFPSRSKGVCKVPKSSVSAFRLVVKTAMLLLLLISGSAGGSACVQSAEAGRDGVKIADNHGGVVWSNDLKSTLRQAGELRKWVIVDVYTDWCGWCKRLDRDTYGNPQVQKMLSTYFLCVKVNAENGSLGPWVSKTYGVTGFPCTLVLDSSSRLKGRVSGYKPPRDFQIALTKIVRQ